MKSRISKKSNLLKTSTEKAKNRKPKKNIKKNCFSEKLYRNRTDFREGDNEKIKQNPHKEKENKRAQQSCVSETDSFSQKSGLSLEAFLQNFPNTPAQSLSRLKSKLPVILTAKPSENYALLDSGNGLKLERFGNYKIIRPESQALWQPRLEPKLWHQADAFFTGNIEEEGLGRWEFLRKDLSETWPMSWKGLGFLGRFTSFRHVGFFPEQEAHWLYIEKTIQEAKRPVSVLNLFGYTGLASLIAARAGAQVTHVDASKKAILWGKENQKQANLEDKPIRWICDDAMKFVMREIRRGKKYDIILLDPPAYGRGTHGEIWHLFTHLPSLLKACRQLLCAQALTVILTAYSIRASFYTIHTLLCEALKDCEGVVESGELVIEESLEEFIKEKRLLSTSLFSRWQNNNL